MEPHDDRRRALAGPGARIHVPHDGATPGRGVVLDGPWRASPAHDELRRAAPLAAFDDDGWEPVTVPGHWRGVQAFAGHDGPLLYRRRFDSATISDLAAATANYGIDADEGARSWLVLDGVFYSSDVWLDGAYLGDTEGYFFPQAFEVTELLPGGDEHVLALEVTCSPQRDRTAKRNLTGVFQHWDLIDQNWNPGGVWRPVRLERSGPVRIRHSRAICRSADPARARLALRAVLDTDGARTVRLRTRVAGVEHEHAQPLAAGENRVEWTVEVENPELWWPWALGAQPLHDLTVDVLVDGDRVSDRVVRRIGFRSIDWRDWKLRVNGERLFLKGANLAPTRLALGEASGDEVARDIELARGAGLDLVRVHAHVGRPELYGAADEAGMLVWQDMPLQWGYHRGVRRQARRQARELVDLLGHHPSIFLWCAHNEPMAIDIEPTAMTDPGRRARLAARAAAAMVLPSWNKTVLDRSIRSVLESCDRSRAVVAHSGVLPHPPQLDGTDSHLYFGWYHGTERDLPVALARWPRLARFVTEFGAQAVPDDAGFLGPEQWPDLDWDAAYEHHALQRPFFDRYVPPAAFGDFASWQAATQRYQAMVVRHQIEALRRIRFRPTGGFAQFCLNDSGPAVTWSVLDHDRRPKLGFEALRRACAPVLPIADRLPARIDPGTTLALEVHVVNDERNDRDEVTLTARISWLDVADAFASPGPAQGPGGAPGLLQDPSHPARPARPPRPAWLDLAELEQAPPTESAAIDAPPTGEAGDIVWRFAGPLPADSCVRVGRLEFATPAAAAGKLAVLDLWLEGAALAVHNRYVGGVVPAGGTPGPLND